MLRSYLIVVLFVCGVSGFAESDPRPESAGGSISGAVVDANDGVVPGATVVLECHSPCKGESTVAGDTGAFEFTSLSLGTSYKIAVSASGFKDWASVPIVLTPEQSTFSLTDVRMRMDDAAASVTVYASQEQVAAEQVRLAEQQRVLGIIPNFYVVYDSKNAVPLSTKLKFELAMKLSTDPITLAGTAAFAGIQQAGGTPNYAGGAKGYGQRLGAAAATGFSDIMIGSAILPSLLHQDPRYFYQGTGTTSSRLRHALLSPFITLGDNGRQQINFSSLGGNLASSALSEAYYPDANRGPRLVFGNFAIGTGGRMLSAVVQEFVLRKLTPAARRQNYDNQEVK
jgi:hypothetical protein